MDNILIIKTGAAGDVVRTTSLLNVLAGRIYWVTDAGNKLLLPEDPLLVGLTIEESFDLLKETRFDVVLSLEENLECARLADQVKTNFLSGIYLQDGKINYTDNSAGWFDMSRVSKLGLTKANQLKRENTESYQSHIFRMVGRKFDGEAYKIFTGESIKTKDYLVGIESRTGPQWPDKQWSGYDVLIDKLEMAGMAVRRFEQRQNVQDYLRDIAGCDHIVSGDTLAMHVALAYRKTCTAIFNCTSPVEIYDYGLLEKVVSPYLSKYFYSSSYDREVIDSVPVDDVYETIPAIA